MRYSIIPNEKELIEQLALAEQYDLGFEYNDFFRPDILDDKDETDRLVALYKSLTRDRANDILHGVFLDIAVHSMDSMIRSISDKRIHQSMEIAAALGVKGVVFHTGIIPNFKSQSYVDGWLKESQDYYRRLLSEYSGMDIYIENMFDSDYELILKLAQEMADCDHFGICLDYAHASVFSDNATEWYKVLMPYIRHMHINDNDKTQDLHLALGDGQIDWDLFFETIKDYDRTLLLEVTGLKRQKKSLDFINKGYR